MNNLVHVNNCHLALLQISGNVIEDMCWFGFSVWGVTGKTEIVDNEITLSQMSSYSKPGAGIAFGVRPKGYVMTPDGAARIEGNRINIGSALASGILVSPYGEQEYTPPGSTVADRSILVRHNTIHMNGVLKGDNAALECLGGCTASNWAVNDVFGSARYGIRVSALSMPVAAPSSSKPTGNSFVENRFGPFTAHRAQVVIGKMVKGTRLECNVFGPVAGTNGANWLTEPCAGVACFGDDGQMIRNDFSSSAIPGWHRGPPAEPGFEEHPFTPPTPIKQPFVDPGVGCIYLEETSHKNTVEYDPVDFPPGTVPPPRNQILDVFHSGWTSLVKKAIVHDNKILELEHV
jgi:hypothetical protein